MGIERVTHYIDNVLTEAQARMGLSNTRLLVAWYTNWENKQSVVHSHPYHELVLPIGGSTVRYSVDGSVYLVHVGELVYFPSQVYHSGNFNIDDAQSDRLVIQIDDALWQATRRRVNLKNADWMHELTVLDSEACRKWDFKGLFIRMAQSQELSDSIRDIVFEAQVAEMLLLITQATGSGQTAAPSSTSVLVARAVASVFWHCRKNWHPAPVYWSRARWPTCRRIIRTRPLPLRSWRRNFTPAGSTFPARSRSAPWRASTTT